MADPWFQLYLGERNLFIDPFLYVCSKVNNTVLIIDDDKQLKILLAGIIANEGFSVWTKKGCLSYSVT